MTERERIEASEADDAPWRRWGPFVSERQWGTVREDYSAGGAAWDYLSHDDARSRAYRWGEDGIGGWCDRHGFLHVALAVWNGRDPILKERFFGLTNAQGNHGEDVKERYWYLDAVPSHAYGRMLYKYPQAAFPYEELVRRNAEAGRDAPEFEIDDTGAFDEDRYFDVEIEHAKDGPDGAVFRATVHNRGPEPAPVWALPHVWFRNTWAWKEGHERPALALDGDGVRVDHPRYGPMRFVAEGAAEWWFTENDTNVARLFGAPNPQPYVKDAFHRRLVGGEAGATNPEGRGTKAAAVFHAVVPAGGSVAFRYALEPAPTLPSPTGVGEAPGIDALIRQRRAEADAFYAELAPGLPPEVANVQRQALAGLLWSKQFYCFDVGAWLDGDPLQPPPPPGRTRDRDWRHVHPAEPMSMPDKWEYPWFAAWDLAFHAIPLALVDPRFAKDQLILLMREWSMHPNGQIPAYEWAFGDVNPPVHAWAALRVYEIDGRRDVAFLQRAFHKLLLNFTWWVNRKDAQGNNVFEGGFLGLDNIGAFDRNLALEEGALLEQCDATSWMAMFCLNMMDVALELARHDGAYEDVASKFFEHFMFVATALNQPGASGADLWDEEDGFYCDALLRPDGTAERLRVRSFVGLIPLFAVTTVEPETVARFAGFRQRMQWFLDHRPDLTKNVASLEAPGRGRRLLLSAVGRGRLERILRRALDPSEFLSPFGLRSVSRDHGERPFTLRLNGVDHTVDYEPGESTSGAFGGNSNWRGPVWFPVNYLLVESLQRFDAYYGGAFRIPDPEPSGPGMTLANVAADLEARLLALFMRGADGCRPCNGGDDRLDFDPHWRDLVTFSEYFHGDTGKGLGAAHQTGWTGLAAKLIQQLYVTAPGDRFGADLNPP